MKLILYNPFHNGDIWLSRGWVDYLLKHAQELGIEELEYRHNCSPRLLADLGKLKSSAKFRQAPFEKQNKEDALRSGIWKGKDGAHYVNTWVCQPGNVGRNEITLMNSYYTLLPAFKRLLGEKFRPTPVDLIPPIILDQKPSSPLDTEKNNVLFCDNKVESLQCSNIDTKPLCLKLREKYPSINFILTSELESIFPLIEGTNLPEISWLSENCDIIFGQGSGPYEVTKTTWNLLDHNKIFICNSGRQFDVLWSEPYAEAKGYWTRDNLKLAEEVFDFVLKWAR